MTVNFQDRETQRLLLATFTCELLSSYIWFIAGGTRNQCNDGWWGVYMHVCAVVPRLVNTMTHGSATWERGQCWSICSGQICNVILCRSAVLWLEHRGWLWFREVQTLMPSVKNLHCKISPGWPAVSFDQWYQHWPFNSVVVYKSPQ